MQPKTAYPYLLLLLALAACQPPATQTPPTPVVSPEPVHGKVPQFAWFYKPPDESVWPLLPERYDFFILTHHDEPERDQIKQLGVTRPFYRYLLLAEIQDPGSCTEEPWGGNQVAIEAGDFCTISSEHPDWFLTDARGERLKNGDDYYYMDPGNAGYRAFWLERARKVQAEYGWDGLFLDNLEASRSKFEKLGGPAQYPDDAAYQQAVTGFLDYLDENYFKPDHIPVVGNIVSVRDPQVWLRYIGRIDGAMLENFATGWHGQITPAEWQEQFDMVRAAQVDGKTILLVAQGDENDLRRQQFAFASYLLLADGRTIFRYAHHSAYRESWWYDDYSLDLGQPLGPARQDGLLWKRDFERGQVSVNPLTQDSGIDLK
jgi:hypothetical protein